MNAAERYLQSIFVIDDKIGSNSLFKSFDFLQFSRNVFY